MKLLLAALLLLPASGRCLNIPAVAGAPVAASSLSESRIREIESLYADAVGLRERSLSAYDQYIGGASAPEGAAKASKVRGMMMEALARRNVGIERNRAALRKKVADGELEQASFERASVILDQAADLGNIFVYAGALPSLLNDLEPGRARVLITHEEFKALDQLYKERAGVPSDAY